MKECLDIVKKKPDFKTSGFQKKKKKNEKEEKTKGIIEK